ncbi:MAG: TonB-dependent receptor [Alphaproteobacteria bacterium]
MPQSAAICSVSVLTLLGALGATITPANAEDVSLPTITVYSTTPQLPSDDTQGDGTGNAPHSNASATTVEDPESRSRPPSIGDTGEFLRHVNGVEAGRMGGHGLDPNIRGLDQNQLTITNDGAYHFGGCPNRMDPPTSHMQLYTYDKVTVKRGYQSVLDGPPAPGGTILFERTNPTFEPGKEVSTNVKAGAGYNSNGQGVESFFDASMGNDWGFVRGYGSYGSANNYKDGDGNEIRSSFDQFGGGLVIGRTFDSDSWVTLKVENNNVDDVLFPGANMDAPKTDDWTYQLKGETDLNWGVIKGVKGDVYLTTVDHTMNNFDLRPQTGNFMEARTESDTLGGKVIFNGKLASGTTFDVGASYRDVMRDGNKWGGANGNYDPSAISSVLWPDTSIKELGLFSEAVVPVAMLTKLTVGLRYDYVNASADKADLETTFGPVNHTSPNTVYQAIYGTDATKDKTEHNISGLMRLEQDLGGGVTAFGSLSRAVRTADATERYMANMMGMAPGGKTSWVGNPDLDPEKHHQIDLGLRYKTSMLNISGSVFYNDVTDYIQRYDGQDMGGNYSSVSIYRNIDAILTGFEAEAQVRLNDVWRVNLMGAYTHGQNQTDHTPLGQIAPFSGRFELIYDNKKLMAGVRVNATAKQTRIDEASSKQDAAN